MPIISTFKTCTHAAEGRTVDWRECFACIDEVQTQLMIARTYLNELAHAEFTDDGICSDPVTEPVRGQSFQRIAQTGLSAAS